MVSWLILYVFRNVVADDGKLVVHSILGIFGYCTGALALDVSCMAFVRMLLDYQEMGRIGFVASNGMNNLIRVDVSYPI